MSLPSEDPRSDYDYVSDEFVNLPDSVDTEISEVVTDLRRILSRIRQVEPEGKELTEIGAKRDVRFDSYSRELYATDASIYEVTPIGVVFPRSTSEVSAVVEYCHEKSIPVLPRGAGTSLAGQAVNEAVVLDFSRHMDEVIDISPDEKIARVEPGVVLAELDKELAEHGLKFAPDPAWGDKSVIGGAIGNNSTGAHSLKYGKTEAYIEEVEVVLADGTVTRLGEIQVENLREKGNFDGSIIESVYAEIEDIIESESETIVEAYPEIKRNVSGYNLDLLIEEAKTGSVNLGRLIAGSEGTLAVVTGATVSLEPVPEEKSMALLAYDGLLDAMEDVSQVLEHDPAAVEVLDGVLLGLAEETAEFEELVGMLPEGTESVLIVEFYAQNEEEGREKVSSLIEERVGERAFDALEAHNEEERERFWKLRKSGLPILLSRTSDEKHISFIEDTAVPPENLAEYVSDFREVLDKHDTFASFYAHAGPGCLHIRPLVNTKEKTGVEKMESIADDVTDLVVEYGGSVSGEHGDGRARTQWNRKLYGDDVWELFQRLKEAFDPDNLLNPGQVCGDVSMSENLRSGPDYGLDAGFEPELNWENENGFEGMVELCHGCGGCRGEQDTTGGVMCPTYRAADEEITSTRGRANMLRQAMSGSLPKDEIFTDEFVSEVLDLCIGCKGCARDCPSEVDMAKLKAELEHEYKERNGSSFRDKLFAGIDKYARLGSKLAPLSNIVTNLPGSGIIAEKTIGIARERSLPKFRRESFHDWFSKREVRVNGNKKAVVFADTYTNYSQPEIGKSLVRVLESAGVSVEVAESSASGRASHSKGFLGKARERAEENVDELYGYIQEGYDLVAVEPSDAVMFQHDYLDLLSGEKVEKVAENSYGALEYLVESGTLSELNMNEAVGEELVYHGHCHQKATKKEMYAPQALEKVGYDVEVLDSGCCGMAGSFGYEKEHYSMSQAIGKILFDQIEDASGYGEKEVVAPGASCRTQIRDEYGERPAHPIEKIEEIVR